MESFAKLILGQWQILHPEDIIENDLFAPLNGAVNRISKSNSVSSVTPFAKAGILSKMSFWWLNPLMKKGKKKTLEDENIPGLSEIDSAESCYLIFEELLNKQKQVDLSSQPSVLKTILICHRKEIIVSGFFALLKVVTVSAGPLLLNAFIKVAEGNASFRNEGLLLAILLFTSKSLESLSQRQWYFRSRLIGLKVRSSLTAAIYRKQIRLSNAAKLMHSTLPRTYNLLHTVGLATIASLVVIILTVLCNTPLAKLQHKFQTKLMVAQDDRLKAISKAPVSMKVLRLYAWEAHFKNVIQILRQVEEKWLSAVQLRRSYNSFLFWSSPVLVSAATFGTCYFLGIPLNASNVFTFVATLRLVQDPVRIIPDVIGVVIQAKVSFERIVKFLEASELEMENLRREHIKSTDHAVLIKSANLSWEENPSRPTLRNINLEVKPGEKVAICGEVGSGKSTLLSTILGEVPSIQGIVQVHGTTAYVSQSAWIQTGTIRENILFGSPLVNQRYQQTLERCSLLKDLELLPYGDLTEIGERGVNLSGGQKQRIQLARALYHDADIYLLDDPFSVVDAHTSTSLFNEYIMGALSGKTILLVTHQVDFLPSFDMVLLMSDGEILRSASYDQLLGSSKEFQDLVNAHKETAGSERVSEAFSSPRSYTCSREIQNKDSGEQPKISGGDQLIKQEERENSWMAANVENAEVSTLRLISVYLLIGLVSTLFLLSRSLSTVLLGLQSSKSLFSQLLNSLFHAPISFYDSTPWGRILSRVSSDLSIVDLDVPFYLIFAVAATTTSYSNLTVLGVVTWQVLFVSIPMVYVAILLQMRINGTTKSFVANHLAESIAGAVTTRAFKEEERFFAKTSELIDINASPFFHNFAANEWLIQRFIGMALSYGLSLNITLVSSIQYQCTLVNYIISVVRLNQYMAIPSEAPEILKENRPPVNWPSRGKVEIQDLQVLGKCQLHEAVEEKEKGLDSLWILIDHGLVSVVEDGSNWSMGQRQLFCLGRALLRKSKILVLDEATASIDNATDMILQKTIRTEFANCTVITVAHRIPTEMDCTMVLAISDGKLVEYDEPMKLMKNEDSLFGQLVNKYWSHYHSAKSHSNCRSVIHSVARQTSHMLPNCNPN
ncbi:hypothetical protein HAX54_030263 [Datura stramonium]|uniref:ABC-type xenobiotic transporter n=1 Tax=Datura stramonium TaxID=4076 RepID=A0ABS8VAU4_DATST|nr:hypothetical protein [Datura stramonium]